MAEEVIIKVKLDRIKPNPYQPESRLEISAERAEKKAQSILTNGLIQMPVKWTDIFNGVLQGVTDINEIEAKG